MRSGESPEGWQKRAAPAVDAPPPKLSILGRLAGALFLLVALAGGLAAYVVIGRESTLAGTLPLPQQLRTVSPAHEDLLLYGRALNELAIEGEGRLRHPAASNRAVAKRLSDRLARLHRTGRELEPRLTREETRAVLAWENAERMLATFFASSTDVSGAFDPQQIRAARAQLALGQALASGKKFDDLVAAKVKKLGTATSASPVDDVRTAADHLRLNPDE